MKKQFIAWGIGLVVIIGWLIFWGMQGESTNEETSEISETGMVLYWGDGCPHCKNVETFIEANHITEKITLTRKEVWRDRSNAKEMERRAKACGLDLGTIGVPFLFSEGKCFIGEPEVEKELLTRAGMDTVSQNTPAEEATQNQ